MTECRKKYINPFTEDGFKKLFGEKSPQNDVVNKEIAKSKDLTLKIFELESVIQKKIKVLQNWNYVVQYN